MKPLKIYIVEDEPLIAVTIETALKKQGYHVCGDTDNVDDALNDIQKMHPDLVLVDIQLEGNKDGIYLAENLDSLNLPYMYLTSQTDTLTINRIKQTKPIGYIAKPFTEQGLCGTIEVSWNTHKQQEPDYISFSSNNELHKIKQSDVLYLKAFDNYCYIITNSLEYLVPKTLKHLSEHLNTALFFKTHRSFIVNITKITSLQTNTVSINAIEIPVSKPQKEALKKLLKA